RPVTIPRAGSGEPAADFVYFPGLRRLPVKAEPPDRAGSGLPQVRLPGLAHGWKPSGTHPASLASPAAPAFRGAGRVREGPLSFVTGSGGRESGSRPPVMEDHRK